MLIQPLREAEWEVHPSSLKLILKVAASSVSQASNLTQNNSTTQGSTSSPNVAEAQAQVLDEAHKLLKSLRLAALHVAEASGLGSGSECERERVRQEKERQ